MWADKAGPDASPMTREALESLPKWHSRLLRVCAQDTLAIAASPDRVKTAYGHDRATLVDVAQRGTTLREGL